MIRFVKRFAIIVLIISLSAGIAWSDDFIPPPEPEQPLLDFELKPANQVPGIIVSAIGLGGGIAMIAGGLGMAVTAVPEGLQTPRFQGGMMLSAGGLVVGAIMSLGLELFTAPLRDRRPGRSSGSR